MNKRKYLQLLIIAVIICIVILLVGNKSYYHPILVSVELRSDSSEAAQLFYNTGHGFNDAESYKKHYPARRSFQKITFQLPRANIQSFRLDPVCMSSAFEIRKIEMRIGSRDFEWSPASMKLDFQFRNLILVDSLNNSALVLRAINNRDAQIILKSKVSHFYDPVDYASSRLLMIMYSLLAVLVGSILILEGKRILYFFQGMCRSVCHYISFVFVKENKVFLIFALFLFLFKSWLVSVQHMTVLGFAGHDDALFIRQAYSLANGNWLGTYDQFTLIKGFVYPFFIAVTGILAIPLLFAQHLLYGLACLVMVHALKPVIRINWVQIIVFAVLFFNPMISGDFALKILRESVATSLSMFVVASLIAMLLNRSENEKSLIRWSMMASLSLFAYWNIREEGMMMVPFTMLFLLAAVMSFFVKPGKGFKVKGIGIIFKTHRKRIILLFFPIFVLLIGNLSLATINYLKYGSFLNNEIKSTAFVDACKALSSIDHNKWEPTVPVPKESREKAYRVSPAFAMLSKSFEDRSYILPKIRQNDPSDIRGGWFIWALRRAANREGYHNSLPESQDYYNLLATELNDAFENGSLDKKPVISYSVYALDKRHFALAGSKLLNVIEYVGTFRGYNPVPIASVGNAATFAKFKNITSEPIAMPGDKLILNYPFVRIRYLILEYIGRLYAAVNPIVFLLSFVAFFYLTVILFLKDRSWNLFAVWLILCGMQYLLLSRIVLNTLISVSQFNAMIGVYLSQVYPPMLLFELIVLIVCFHRLRERRLAKKTT